MTTPDQIPQTTGDIFRQPTESLLDPRQVAVAGVALQGAGGELTPDAQAYSDLLTGANDDNLTVEGAAVRGPQKGMSHIQTSLMNSRAAADLAELQGQGRFPVF